MLYWSRVINMNSIIYSFLLLRVCYIKYILDTICVAQLQGDHMSQFKCKRSVLWPSVWVSRRNKFLWGECSILVPNPSTIFLQELGFHPTAQMPWPLTSNRNKTDKVLIIPHAVNFYDSCGSLGPKYTPYEGVILSYHLSILSRYGHLALMYVTKAALTQAVKWYVSIMSCAIIVDVMSLYVSVMCVVYSVFDSCFVCTQPVVSYVVNCIICIIYRWKNWQFFSMTTACVYLVTGSSELQTSINSWSADFCVL